LLKDYEIDKLDPSWRYQHRAVDWYKRKHAHILNGYDEDAFLDKKPSKDTNVNETLKNTRDKIKVNSQQVGMAAKDTFGKMKSSAWF